MIIGVNHARQRSRLAPAASAPGCAAASNEADSATASAASAGTATATATTTTATTTAATTTTATTATTASSCELDVAFLRRSRVLLVEDVEGGEADVSDFFFAERDLLIG
jgi:hypothetical protein